MAREEARVRVAPAPFTSVGGCEGAWGLRIEMTDGATAFRATLGVPAVDGSRPDCWGVIAAHGTEYERPRGSRSSADPPPGAGRPRRPAVTG